jgi:glycosyltransferase involved in cell wall biosynthesis
MDKEDKEQTLALVPCLNEGTTIGSVVLKAKNYVDKVLVVDDGSTDDTAKIALDAGAIVISHKKNMGKSTAIKTGFNYVLKNNFKYVVTIDGDGQHDPHEIPTVMNNVLNNGHDISIGTRFGNTTEMPGWRKVGKRILDYATSFGNGGQITDSQSGFRAFNFKAIKSITPKLKGNSFNVESEQLIRAHEMGLEVGKTRISCKYKGLDTSTKNSTSHGFSVLKYVLWLVAEKRPLLFIGVPGFILVILGLILGIYTLQYYNSTHVFLIPIAIIVSIFLIIGVILMFMGLMLNLLPNILRRARDEIL